MSNAKNNIPNTLREEARSFIGRDWVLPIVDNWREDANKFLVLTGVAGSGKSMICAWLAGADSELQEEHLQRAVQPIQDSWSASFFCARRTSGASIDPQTFIGALASQLAADEPEFAQIALKLLPTAHQINIDVQTNLGSVVGIRANNLWLTGVDATEAFAIAVKEPLRRLATNNPGRKLSLIIDGLDEAIGYGRTSIADLVAGMSDLPVNIKLLVSFKRDRRLRDLFGSNDDTAELDLSSSTFREANDQDISRYVTARLSADARFTSERTSQASRCIQHAASGNFQYVRHLIREIESGRRPLEDLTGLPRNLDELYRAHLDRLIPQMQAYGNAQIWREQYVRTIGPLVVSEAPLQVDVLKDLADVDQAEITRTLDELQQIIETNTSRDRTVQFFHSSITTYFTMDVLPGGNVNPYFVDPLAEHRRIVDHYYTRLMSAWQGNWNRCDDYGLTYLAAHIFRLAEDDPTSSAEVLLYDLVQNESYRDAQRARFGHFGAATQTARAALDLATKRGDVRYLRQMLQSLSLSRAAMLRGLSVGFLVDRYTQDSDQASDIIKMMIKSRKPELIGVALNAVSRIGVSAGAPFRWMALKGPSEIRQLAAYGAYLEWTSREHQPVSDFLEGLAHEVRAYRPIHSRRVIRYLANATVQIYVSLCHERSAAELANHIWYEVIRTRLHANLVNRPFLERLVVNSAAGSTLSKRISDAALLADLQPPSKFFAATRYQREHFLRSIDFLRPDADLLNNYDSVSGLLQSEILFHRVLGSMVISTHAHRDLSRLEDAIRSRFDSLPPIGQLWHLFSFATLFPSDSPSWHDIVEWQTDRALKHLPGLMSSAAQSALTKFNVVLLPLGLAAGRAGVRMTLVEQRLREALEDKDELTVAYLLEGIGYVGFYYPDQALAAFSVTRRSISSDIVRDGLIRGLATMSVLRPQLVDLFLEELDRPDLRPMVQGSVDITRTKHYIDRIGFFNNAVNQAVMHPVMRDGLLIPSLQVLAQARTQREYIRRYTPLALRMLRQHDYKLIDWWT